MYGSCNYFLGDTAQLGALRVGVVESRILAGSGAGLCSQDDELTLCEEPGIRGEPAL